MRTYYDHRYSFGDYQKQYDDDDVSSSGDDFALDNELIDKRMHHSVRDAVMATLEDDDKDGTFNKVLYLIVNPQHACARVTILNLCVSASTLAAFI